MQELALRHEIDTDEATYWTKLVFDADVYRKIYEEHLGFPTWKLLDQREDDAKITRLVHVEPPLGNLPGPLKKLAGERFSYTENGTFDKKAGRYTFSITPSTMADKAKIVGYTRIEKLSEKKIARHCHLSVDVKVFMVGPLIEEKVAGDFRHSYDKSAVYLNAYVKEHRL